MSRRELEVGVRRLVTELSTSGFVSAVTALIANDSVVLASASGGRRRRASSSKPTAGSLFDLASLTKPLTATLAVRLEASRVLPLATRLHEIWGPAVDRRFGRVRLEDLLRHQGGLLPWTPLYATCNDGRAAIEVLLSGALLGSKRVAYSDLGYILWGASAERALGESLAALLKEHVLRPLGLGRQITASRPDPRRLVECELTPSKEASLAREQGLTIKPPAPAVGEIQDGNARWWKGLAGHAGLFGSATGLLTLAREWLDPEHLERDIVDRALSGRGEFLLGWRRPTKCSGAEPLSVRQAFGHTGFTGGSLWVDAESRLIYLLLSHRLDDSFDLDPWRRRFHSLGRHVDA